MSSGCSTRPRTWIRQRPPVYEGRRGRTLPEFRVPEGHAKKERLLRIQVFAGERTVDRTSIAANAFVARTAARSTKGAARAVIGPASGDRIHEGVVQAINARRPQQASLAGGAPECLFSTEELRCCGLDEMKSSHFHRVPRHSLPKAARVLADCRQSSWWGSNTSRRTVGATRADEHRYSVGRGIPDVEGLRRRRSGLGTRSVVLAMKVALHEGALGTGGLTEAGIRSVTVGFD